MSTDVTLLSHEGKKGLKDAHTKEPKEGVVHRMSKTSIRFVALQLHPVASRSTATVFNFTLHQGQSGPNPANVIHGEKGFSEVFVLKYESAIQLIRRQKKNKTAADTSST